MTKFDGILIGAADLRTVFNDIPTGYTPTNPNDGSFCDFSKLECLDTPTPLSNTDTDTYFVYPPNSSKINPTYTTLEERNKLHYCKPDWSSAQVITSNGITTDAFSMPTECSTYQMTELLNPPLSSITTNITDTPATICQSSFRRPTDLPIPHYPTQVREDQAIIPIPVTPHPVHFNLPPISTIKLEEPVQLYSDTTYQFPDNAVTHSGYQQSITELSGSTYSYDYRRLKQSPHNNHFDMEQAPVLASTISSSSSSSTSSHKASSTNGTRLNKPKPLNKAFACQFVNCIKRFARIDELKRHQRTHSDVRQFVCETCTKGFTRSDHLMTHRRTHTGERPYACIYCERRFARSDERNRHMKVHTRDKTKPLPNPHHPPPRRPRCLGSRSLQLQTTFSPMPLDLSPIWPERIMLQT